VAPLAGFEVTAYGRIWGDRRGKAARSERNCSLIGQLVSAGDGDEALVFCCDTGVDFESSVR